MPETTPATTLADLCGDLLAFAMQLRRSSDPGDADAMRQRIDEQFRNLETRARQSDVPQEDVQQAKYAIAAFIDEMILTSNWSLKDSWADKPLQLTYFNDFSAGEEFYNKIETLRAGKKNAVLEVYYLCLALGFRGKFVDMQGMEKKKVLIDSLLREIRGAGPASGPGMLSPSWQPPDSAKGLGRRFPAWLVAAACAIVLLGLYLALSAWMGSTVDRAVQGLE